jgi:hypothetical protein
MQHPDPDPDERIGRPLGSFYDETRKPGDPECVE